MKERQRSLISAECRTLNPDLNIEMNDSELPATHGTEITYRCKWEYAKKGHVNAVCQDGTIVFPSGSSPCFKIGNVLIFNYKIIINP
jgi:hypothetical protein